MPHPAATQIATDEGAFGPATTLAGTRPLPAAAGAAIPGGPDLAKPVRREDVDGVSLETYARVSAQIAEQRRPSAEILREAAIEEAKWYRVERTWLLRIAVALAQGDGSLAAEHERLYRDAQDALGEGDPPRSLAEYAAIVLRLGRGEPAPRVLADARLSPAGWGRTHRTWAQRAAADPRVAAELEALLRPAR